MGSCCSSESQKSGKARQPQSHLSFEMHNIDPLNYVPENAMARIRNPKRIVTAVHFVAHSVLESGGNHWDIFFETGNQSVRLEIGPGAYPGREGYIGRVDIIHNSYKITRHQHMVVTIPPAPGHSVADFLNTVVAAGNHRYEFTREGRGCTGWVRDQFYLFVEMGLLPTGWEPRIEAALTSAWVNGVSQGPWPVTQGRYLRQKKGRMSAKAATRS